MAVKEILKSTAKGILGKGLRRVAGNLGSLLGGTQRTESSDFEGIARSKRATNILSFPIDVGNADAATGGNHGHYIMFFINEQTHAKLRFDSVNKSLGTLIGEENLFKEGKKRGFGVVEKIVDSITGKFIEKNLDPLRFIFEFGSKGGRNTKAAAGIINDRVKTGDINKKPQESKTNFEQTISVHRRPVKRLNSVITMFMPADVKVSYKSNFTDTSIGTGAQAASQTLGASADAGGFTNAGISAGTEALKKNVGDLTTQAGRDALLAILSVAPIFEGSKEAIEIGMGTTLTDRMEMAFKGIDKRKFSYTFKMMARSQDESDEIKKIVDMFKFHMLPEMAGATSRGRLMHYPSTFDIKYMYQNSENNYLNKVSECYLESMDVDYGGDRYRTFEGNNVGAPPVETTITLQFGEIELITRERAVEGF